MRRRGALALALGGAALLATMTACGQNEPSYGSPSSLFSPFSPSSHPSRSSYLPTHTEVVENESSYASQYSPPTHAEVLDLDDGRRVAMYYDQGRGLVEQHYSTQARAWSKPQLLYKTRTEPCPDITLKDFGDTVAVIADFARFCGDGEPPDESIAAVGVGSLEKWYTHLTRHFDGWDKVQASSDTKELTFTYPHTSPRGVTRLRWSQAGGFSDLEDIPR